MARHWTEQRAICSAVAAAPTASTAARATRSGWPTHHSSTRMPPIEPPTTPAQRSMPRRSARSISAATWSRIGEAREPRRPTGGPSGAGDAGPVVPWQPPEHVGADHEVAVGVDGPTGSDELLPPARASGDRGPTGPAAWESPVSACRTRTALAPPPSRVPHVS